MGKLIDEAASIDGPLAEATLLLERADKVVANYFDYNINTDADAIQKVMALGVLANAKTNLAWTKLMASTVKTEITERE